MSGCKRAAKILQFPCQTSTSTPFSPKNSQILLDAVEHCVELVGLGLDEDCGHRLGEGGNPSSAAIGIDDAVPGVLLRLGLLAVGFDDVPFRFPLALVPLVLVGIAVLSSFL